ncbi:hypothetical protein B0H16DRAFT_1480614 [Mycena metata]|uniref:Uncharacterized protein n=1 Tax=Mycena metata TaxID=1033252 RepID=A0AAD7H315_9AGAR|nr:hypothetical protein B0H16DRAFT_1480614 [Mycena metata]
MAVGKGKSRVKSSRKTKRRAQHDVSGPYTSVDNIPTSANPPDRSRLRARSKSPENDVRESPTTGANRTDQSRSSPLTPIPDTSSIHSGDISGLGLDFGTGSKNGSKTVSAGTPERDDPLSVKSKSSKNSRKSHMAPDELEFKLSVIPPTPQEHPLDLESDNTSPMPEIATESVRRAQRGEKKRRPREEDNFSEDLKEAARRSMRDLRDHGYNSADESDAARWRDLNIKSAYTALKRDREIHENTREFERRQAAWQRGERDLRKAQLAQLDADRQLAEHLHAVNTARMRAEREKIQKVQGELGAKRNTKRSETPPVEINKEYKIYLRKVASEDYESQATDSDVECVPPPRITHTFQDRVVLQKYRREELAAKGESGVPDQGVDWDKKGKPFEVRSAMSRGSSVGTRGGKRMRRIKDEASPGLSPGGAEAKDMAGGTGRSRSYKNESSRDERQPSRPPESTPNQRMGGGNGGAGGSRPPNRSGPNNSEPPSSPSSSGDEEGSGDEEETETETPTEGYDSDESIDWNKDPMDLIHEVQSKIKKENSIKKEQSSPLAAAGGAPEDRSSSSSDENERPGKGPSRTPRRKLKESEPGDLSLAGQPSHQIVKWKKSLHQPIINHYNSMLGKKQKGSSILDENRNVCIPPPEKYNGDKNIKAFESHIASIVQWLQIIGLSGPAEDERRKGLHSFRLTGAAKEWYDTRVNGIQRPKKKWTHLQMILGLFDYFIDTSCVQQVTTEFWEAKFSAEIGAAGFYHELVTKANRMVKKPDSYTFKNHFIEELPAPMVRHLLRNNVTAEYCTIKDILSEAINYETQKSIEDRYAHARERTSGSRKSSTTTGAKTGSSSRNKNVKMYAQRDIVDDVSDEGTSKSGGKSDVPDEQMRNAEDDNGDDTSEGGYTMQEFSDYELSDGERGAHMRVCNDEIPGLLTDDDDSEWESTDGSAGSAVHEENAPRSAVAEVFYATSTSRRRARAKAYAVKHAGLFEVCDEWDAVEQIGAKDLDKVAREMAANIIEQGHTNEVEEFLFATGERYSLTPSNADGKLAASGARRRQVRLRKSNVPKERPARKKEDNFPLTSFVTINGHKAFTLFDSGCTTDSCSPDFARVADIKVHPITKPVTLAIFQYGWKTSAKSRLLTESSSPNCYKNFRGFDIPPSIRENRSIKQVRRRHHLTRIYHRWTYPKRL